MERLLEAVLARSGHTGLVAGLHRLSGGANMESWVFACGDDRFVLRRAPSAEWIAARPLGMAGEAELIRQAHAAGVKAPEIVAELASADNLGIGFIMRCLEGTADPEVALSSSAELATDLATALAGIHAVSSEGMSFLPVLDPAEGVEGLARQFDEAGGDRPVIALGLAWLRKNLPPPAPQVIVHGDFRIGNLMVHEGRLSGVLDWELAHLGDGHEDLAYGCMTVWRFGRLDKQGFGLTDLASVARAYEEAGGERFDPARFRFWLVYRTVWWALGCLSMGQAWRSGTDRSLERVVVARRCAEQELDLLLLLECEAPQVERERPVRSMPDPVLERHGEPAAAEILTAVSEWLAATVKDKLAGRERWELAVAQNALGIVRRELAGRAAPADKDLADEILAGRQSLHSDGLLATLRFRALSALCADMPKYPALEHARALWSQD